MKPDSLRSKIQRVIRQDLGYLPESASTASINQIIAAKFGDVSDIPDVADELISEIKLALQEASDSSSAISVTTKSTELTQQKKDKIALTVADSLGITTQIGTDKILEVASNFSTSATNSRAYRKEILALFKEWVSTNLANELASLQNDLNEIVDVVNTQESILSQANNQFDDEITKLGTQMISNYNAAKASQTDNLGKLRLALGLLSP